MNNNNTGRAAKAAPSNLLKGNPQNRNSTTGRSARRRRNRNRPQAGAIVVAHSGLSKCSKDYLMALVEPWELNKPQACIPDMIDTPSLKVRSMVRTTLQVGLLGFGFVTINSQANSNDNAIGASTNSSYNASTTIPLGVGPVPVGLNPIINSQFLYGGSAIPSLGERTVACGIRVRYIGTSLQSSGRVIAARSQEENNNFSAIYTVQTLLSAPAVSTEVTGKGWTGVTYVPVSPDEYAYKNVSISGLLTTDLIIAIDGATPGNAYEVEIYYHKELVPLKNSGAVNVALFNVTASHSDVVGLSAIRNFIGETFDNLKGWTYKKALANVEQFLSTSAMSVMTNTMYRAAPLLTGRNQMRLEM